MARVELGKSSKGVVAKAARLTSFKVSQIQRNPENPRPSDLAIEEMAADLIEHDQIHGINVVHRARFVELFPELADQLNDRPYVVINGNRRHAGAERGGLDELRGEIRDDWTRQHIREAVIRENVHRVDLDPVRIGHQLVRMLPDYENSQRQLAAALGVNRTWVQQRIVLTQLAPALQAAVSADTVPFKIGRECTRLHPELQEPLASGELPIDLARRWLVNERIKPGEQMRRWTAGPPYEPVPTLEPAPAALPNPEHDLQTAPEPTAAASGYPVATPVPPSTAAVASSATSVVTEQGGEAEQEPVSPAPPTRTPDRPASQVPVDKLAAQLRAAYSPAECERLAELLIA